jgi:carbonic anhydrase
MPDDLLLRLRRFHDHTFPGSAQQFQDLVRDGQHPTILFIGCSDSRLVPYLLTGTGPGELFIVRNVGAFVPPYDGSAGYHGTSAAIEFAVLNLQVSRIVVCGHSHCGAIRAPTRAWATTPQPQGLAGPGARGAAAGASPARRRCAAPSSARWCCSWNGSWTTPWCATRWTPAA